MIVSFGGSFITPTLKFLFISKCVLRAVWGCHIFSQIHQKLTSNEARMRWQRDVGINMNEMLWSDLHRDEVRFTLNSMFRFIQLNFFSVSFTYGLEEGTFIYSTCSCSKVHSFWQNVCNIISQIHGIYMLSLKGLINQCQKMCKTKMEIWGPRSPDCRNE